MSKPLERRAFLGIAGAGAASLLLFGRSRSSAAGMKFAVNRGPAEWRRLLGDQRYHILREAEKAGWHPAWYRSRYYAGCLL